MFMEQGFTPRIVGFLCNWCSYSAANLAGATKLEIPSSPSVYLSPDLSRA